VSRCGVPTVLQLVHGYPPRENAGVEHYTARLGAGLRARGWTVHVLAATLEPGRPMYERIEEEGVTRVVNNAPYAALRRGPADSAIDAVVAEVAAKVRPDVVHVQHLHGLSTSLPRVAPTVWTLHDGWGWCAAGGLLLRDGAPCAGPGPACAACAGAWVRDPPFLARSLALAGRLSAVVPPERLHRAWKRLPAGLRRRALAGPVAPVDAQAIARRHDAFRAFAARVDRVVCASRWFAGEAERHLGVRPLVVPQGRDPTPSGDPGPDAPFLFLGTLAFHKGPDLVRAAWELAGRPAPLRVHGPPGPDPSFTVPNDGPVAVAEVPGLLAGARALVLGSRWPENAPLVIEEARAAGCPVVAPDLGGVPEVVQHGVDGWLYPPGDAGALAACLREAALHRPTPRPPPPLSAHLDAVEALYGRLVG